MVAGLGPRTRRCTDGTRVVGRERGAGGGIRGWSARPGGGRRGCGGNDRRTRRSGPGADVLAPPRLIRGGTPATAREAFRRRSDGPGAFWIVAMVWDGWLTDCGRATRPRMAGRGRRPGTARSR